MNIQNRTFEFQQCVNTYDKIHRPKVATAPTTHKSRFSSQAAVIAKDIAHTTELLSKLALLAKRKPLFDDKPVEIGELTYVIKQDIFRIEQSIKNLQAVAKGDTSISVDSQVSQHSKNVLTLLNSKMKNVSGEFKSVLETRQKNEILSKNRTENFLSVASANSQRQSGNQLPHLSYGENPYSSINPDDDPDTLVPYSTSNYNNGEFLLIPDQTRQLLMMEDQSQQYLQQRNTAVETIESTINEVGNLFQQLATMVSEQGETIQRIDQNVDDISINIDGAQRELLKYFHNISSNRWLFLKIFGVLIVFFLLWVVVS